MLDEHPPNLVHQLVSAAVGTSERPGEKILNVFAEGSLDVSAE